MYEVDELREAKRQLRAFGIANQLIKEKLADLENSTSGR